MADDDDGGGGGGGDDGDHAKDNDGAPWPLFVYEYEGGNCDSVGGHGDDDDSDCKEVAALGDAV